RGEATRSCSANAKARWCGHLTCSPRCPRTWRWRGAGRTGRRSARGCDGVALPAGHEYLHLHPAEKAGGGAAPVPHVEGRRGGALRDYLWELVYAAEKSAQRAAALELLRELARVLPVLGLPETAAEAYGTIRTELERKGQMIGNNDLWIAAHARAAGLTLVTNNEREFRPVRGLKVENWTV